MKLPANADTLAANSTHLTIERRKQILDHIRATDSENDQSTAKCILKNGGPEADFLKDIAARANGPAPAPATPPPITVVPPVTPTSLNNPVLKK